MHIPDGFLSPEIWILMWAVSAGIITYALWKTDKKLEDKKIPLMGVVAAFVFAAQMLNMPVAGGTSGHMLGGVLSAALLGPFTASIAMAAVFIVQGLFFQDGGITALGANMFNMGFIGTICCYYLYAALKKPLGMLPSAAVSAWLAVVLAAAGTSIVIGLSGTADPGAVLAAMIPIHAIIGVIEAGLTVTVLAFISKARPDLLGLEKI